MSSKEDRIDPRVKRTRRLLEQSFLELLREKGFQSVTVQDITDRATVNRATFYAHFDDKFALLDHVIRDSFQQVLQKNLALEAGFSLDNLHILIVSVCEYLEQFHRLQCKTSTKQFEPLIEKEVQNQVYHLVLRWVNQLQEGEPEPATTPDVIASAISWAIFGVELRWSRDGQKYPVEDVSNQVLTLLTTGLYGSFSPELADLRQGAGSRA